MHFPANGFIDDSRRHVSDDLANRDAIQEYCIAPGSSCHLIYVNAHVFYVHHVSFNDRMLSSLHRNNRIALHQVTGAAAELVLDSDWIRSASPSQLLPCATARVASSTDRCITFRNRLPCASLVRSTQIFEIFPCGKCDKPTSMQHWSGRCDEYSQQLCNSRVPDAANLQCYFCKRAKSLQCFSLPYPVVEINIAVTQVITNI